MSNPSFNAGMLLVAQANQTDYGTFIEKQACIETLKESPTFCSEICATAGVVMDLAGKELCFERQLIDVLQKEASIGNPTAQVLLGEVAESVLEVLGGSDVLAKEAAQGAGALTGVLARLGLAATPGAIKLLLGTGAALGTSAGALSWALNRHANQDESDIMAMQARIDEYNRITEEIRNKMKEKGLTDAEDTEDAVKEISGAKRVNLYG